jgi:hypothetical protein
MPWEQGTHLSWNKWYVNIKQVFGTGKQRKGTILHRDVPYSLAKGNSYILSSHVDMCLYSGFHCHACSNRHSILILKTSTIQKLHTVNRISATLSRTHPYTERGI